MDLTISNEHALHRNMSAAQIQAVRTLQLSGMELSQQLAQALREIPALEGEELELCPRCHRPVALKGERGCQCDSVLRDEHDSLHDEMPLNGRDEWEVGATSAGTAGYDDDDDPMARLCGRDEYGAGLNIVLHAMIPDALCGIADYLVQNLDSHGLLPADIVEDACVRLGVTAEAVETVLARLQQLDPPGIGARSAQESLVLQMQRLNAEGAGHELAETLLRDHFEDLAAKHYREISHRVNIPPRLIELEIQYIARRLHPFPAHGYDPDLGGIATGAPPIQPDVVIRRTEQGFATEVVEQRRWSRLHISESYMEARAQMKQHISANRQERDHVRHSLDEATNLINALRQRWQTMRRVTEALIEMQADFLEHGPSGLVPMTRKKVGERLGLHESTVSRATDGKFVLLPNGKTVPFDDFFNDSLQVKDAIAALIDAEDARHPYSDEQIAVLLKQRGMEVARRTVAKYREEIGKLPSRLRRNRVASVKVPAPSLAAR